jgi:hypothetical protein
VSSSNFGFPGFVLCKAIVVESNGNKEVGTNQVAATFEAHFSAFDQIFAMVGVHLAFIVLVALGALGSVTSKIAPPPSTAKKIALLRGGGSAVDEISSLDWRYFAAGGICAAFSHGITTPIGKSSTLSLIRLEIID